MMTLKRSILIATALCAGTATAQAAPSLFFSEYVEGSGFNKALEIYNPTDAPVNLAGYAVAVYFNGSAKAGTTVPLTGTIAPGKTFVFADKQADAAVLAVANQTYGGSLYNGDDAVALLDNGNAVDVIGQIGYDPGAAWGTGDTTTQNHTLRRDFTVTSGRADGSTPFDPAREFSGYAQDSFADLGQYGQTPPPTMVAFGSCGDPATPIHDIQGSTDISPLNNDMRVVEAIVTARYPGTTGLDGLFIQAGDNERDNNSNTSEGLFVFTGDSSNLSPDMFKVGQRIRVRGTVSEFNGLTELKRADRAQICGSGYTVSPTQLSLPFKSMTAPEALEGMRVKLSQTLTATDTYTLGRFGEVMLSAGGRLNTPTNVVAPGRPAQALAAQNARNALVLDDGMTVQNPDPVIYPAPRLTALNTLRVGDTVTGIDGVLTYDFGAWVVEPVTTPTFDPTNPRPTAADLPTGGNIRVASFNVLNFFNGDGQGGGFPTSRGADTQDEFDRQKAKIVSAITDIDADVVGLMEIENDGYGSHSAIAELVAGLNQASPRGEQYAFIDPGTMKLGTDQIAVGLIYDASRVTPVGQPATLTTKPFVTGNRQPLAQTFQTADGERLTVVVNHLKAKGSCPSMDDPNAAQGDGQSCWNLLRTQAVNDETTWLAGNPTGGNTGNVLVIGDMNAYSMEDPIAAFETAGYKALLKSGRGTPATTFVFDGQSGALDHALANETLQSQVIASKPFHINADEPTILDYNVEFKSPSQVSEFYDAGPYRASDHDPVVTELELVRGK